MSRIRLKLFASLIVLIFTMSLFPYVRVNADVIVDFGTCGPSLNWELNGEGVLTISGSGDMYNFDSNAPWDDYSDDIKSVVIENGVGSIGNYAFSWCQYLTSVTIPDTVTLLGVYAFYHCESLESITIPNGVTSIGDCDFMCCYKLASVTFSENITSIGDSAFGYCTSLESVTIPKNVTSIGNSTFSGCSGLESLTLSESLTSIGTWAFCDCANLTSIIIPERVTSIGNGAFYGCKGLVSVTISDKMLNSDYNEDISLTTTLSDKLKLYYSVDFVTGAHGKVGIASRDYKNGIVSLYVTPDSNYRIDKITVTGTNGTEDLTPVSGVYSVDTSKEDVTVTTTFKEAGNSILASGTCGDYLYWELNDDGVLTISGTGDMEYNNVPWSAYSNSIESVVISSGVTSIGENAFAGCDYLTEITIPEDVTSIGTAAFYGCPNLTNITLPESLTAIGEYAFRMCTGLTNITIPKNVTSIGRGTFDRCSSLTSITISDGVFSIGDCAFQDCTNLTSVIFPDSITSIGDAAFFGCSGLVSITLFDGMTSIGDHAFTDCSSLTDVYYFGTEEQFAAISDPIRPFTPNVNIHYLTPLEILTQPADYTGPIGSKATFSVEAEGEELKYQWQYNSKGVWKNSGTAGNKTSKIKIDITYARDGLKFRCVVTDGYGNEEISDEAAIHVAPELTITDQPVDYSGPLNSTATFSVIAEGEDLTYQWQYYSKGTWKNSGAAGNKTQQITVDITSARDGMKFRCVVKDGYGIEKISDEATIHVTSALTITEQPEDFTGPVGSKATFSVEAEGADLKYQWQYYSKGVWKNSGAAGNKTSQITVDVTEARDGMEFRCVVTDGYGNEEISGEAVIHVGSLLEITGQPEDFTGPVGSTATFSIEAEGNDLTYQWQYYSKGTWKNSGASGNKTPEITVDITNARDGMKFRCVVTDGYGNEEISDEAAIHVAPTLTITEQPADYSGTLNSTATFSVVAEGNDLIYQWQYYSKGVWKNSGASGNKTPEITVDITGTRDGMKFRCIVSDKYGNEDISDEVTLHVIEAT